MGRLNLKAPLSRRENEIAELLAWGAAKKEVADRLKISTRTVENTARHIYEKIGIQKATELCVFWFCAKCGVSPSLDPLKRAFIALFFLLSFLPSEILAPTDNAPTTIKTAPRATRGRRQAPTMFNPFEF